MAAPGEAVFSLVSHKVEEVRDRAAEDRFATEAAATGGAGGRGGGDGGKAWHLDTFGVQAARERFGVDGTGVCVAVIDTGVHAAHPDLHGRVTAHDYTGAGDGGDEDGHGTHVCGIVHAVAPGAEIHSFRVFGPDSRAVMGNIMSALHDIKIGRHGRFDVVNMSLGAGEPCQEMRLLLLELNARGALLCCAAGNEGDHDGASAPRFGTVSWPAQFNSTIAVGSVDARRRRSPYSSSGPKITIMGPGENVWSCWNDGRTARLSGTSMASPFVAGVIVLALEACRKRRAPRPNMSEMLCCMATSCLDLEAPGFDFFTGYGCIEPGALIDRVLARAARYE
eukprot:jgi/Tetstr1/454000/TSEL_040919.t1